jgi:spore germination protein
VQFGDSVYRIAARYGVTSQAIIEANQIENPNRIFYGQILIIPK